MKMKLKFDESGFPHQENQDRIDSYGAIGSLARYVGYKSTPPFNNEVYWQHGWTTDYMLANPLMIAGVIYIENSLCFVGKKNDEKYLQENGYSNALAIGLPIVYTPDITVKRIPKSLLVMPVHSIGSTEYKTWDFKKYVDEIKSIRHLFDKIVVCVHPSCLVKGYWIDDFKAEGFEVIIGIDGSKTNAFTRLQYIMKSFEFMTTNSFGSHIAYAAYWGVKVSVFGTYSHHTEEELGKDPFYKICPEALKLNVHFLSKEVFFKHFSKFFVDPDKATLQISLGQYEIGFENKKTPDEIKKLMGWTLKGWLKFYLTKAGIRYLISKVTTDIVKKTLRRMKF